MKRNNAWAKFLLLVVGAFYTLPMLAMARFSFQKVPVIKLGWSTLLKNWTIGPMIDAVTSARFLEAGWLSVRLAFLSVLLSLLILVPTTVYVHVRFMRARAFVELLSILPFVVPPIALVVGISSAMRSTIPSFLSSPFSLVPFYVVIALPFSFRSLDVGLSSIDLKTLVEASRSLGAGWMRTVSLVILPNIKTGVVSASFLTFAVVLGEFTIASLLLKFTLPAYLAEAQGNNPQGTFTVGLLLIVVSALLLGVMNRITRGKSQIVSTIGI
jgi:putative spermidine/putrescine transport system permease protein